MDQAERMCPQCGIPMKEVPLKAEPNAMPRIAAQSLQDVTAGVLIMRLECPACQHVEGRHPKGQGTWKDAMGNSAG